MESIVATGSTWGSLYPATENKVISVLRQTGDVLPWSATENLLLLAPTAICGVRVPRKLPSNVAASMIGVDIDHLRSQRTQMHPLLGEIREYMEEAVKATMNNDHANAPFDEDENLGVA